VKNPVNKIMSTSNETFTQVVIKGQNSNFDYDEYKQ